MGAILATANRATAKPVILVVDDHRDSSELLQLVLSKKGYQVDVADSPSEAKLAFGRRRPAVLITDFHFAGQSSVEDNGASLCRWAALHHPDCVRMVLSGNCAEETRDSVAADVFMNKPLDLHRLYACLEQYLPLRAFLEPGFESSEEGRNRDERSRS